MDGDGFIGTTDIEHALKLLTQNELNMDEIQSVWEKVRTIPILENISVDEFLFYNPILFQF
jgi:hypothetical protein